MDKNNPENIEINPFNSGFFESHELRSFGFKSVGENVRIARSSLIVGLGNISLGSNVRIDSGVTIIANKGYLALGSFIHVGGGCHISCAGGVSMGDFSGLSQGVRIYSVTDDYSGQSLTNPTVPAKYTNVRLGEVLIGRHVIVGAGSVILPGVHISEGVSIGALSLVSRSLGEWGIYAGCPARKIKERDRSLLVLEAELLNSKRSNSPL
jgi:acetyltransferase-like isoleucine patch superfamily enzyme